MVVLFTEGRPDPGVAPPWLLCLPPGSAAVDFVRLPRFSEQCMGYITNHIDGNMSNLMELYNGYIWLIYIWLASIIYTNNIMSNLMELYILYVIWCFAFELAKWWQQKGWRGHLPLKISWVELEGTVRDAGWPKIKECGPNLLWKTAFLVRRIWLECLWSVGVTKLPWPDE